MNNVYDKLIFAFKNLENLEFTEDEFIDYDKFIDDEILNCNLVKFDEYNFIGINFASKINTNLSSKIFALYPYNTIIDVRCKGQAAYFLVDNKIGVLTFSTNALTFFPSKLND